LITALPLLVEQGLELEQAASSGALRNYHRRHQTDFSSVAISPLAFITVLIDFSLA
jgi:hypothetical protein